DRRFGCDQLAHDRVAFRFPAWPARRSEARDLRGLQPELRYAAEELDVLRVGAGPAALDVMHADLIQPRRDLELVVDRQRQALALRAVAERRVVEDDRGCHRRRRLPTRRARASSNTA